MNILYRTIYKVEINGRTTYNTVYSLHNTGHFPTMNHDEMSRGLAECLVSDTVSIHSHGRADINGEVKGRADGLVSFDLSIDNHEIFTEYNRVDLKGFLEWVSCEGGQVHANSVFPGVFDGEYKGIRFRYLPKEGWVSVKAANCPLGKGIACYSIQEFVDAIEYSISVQKDRDETLERLRKVVKGWVDANPGYTFHDDEVFKDGNALETHPLAAHKAPDDLIKPLDELRLYAADYNNFVKGETSELLIRISH